MGLRCVCGAERRRFRFYTNRKNAWRDNRHTCRPDLTFPGEGTATGRDARVSDSARPESSESYYGRRGAAPQGKGVTDL